MLKTYPEFGGQTRFGEDCGNVGPDDHEEEDVHEDEVEPLVELVVEVLEVGFEDQEEVEDHDEDDYSRLVESVRHARNLYSSVTQVLI